MQVQPDTAAALAFLTWAYPAGPWTLTAIHPNKKNMETATFSDTLPEALKLAAAQDWIARHNGTMNLYWQVNPASKALRKKAEREDIEALSWLHVDIDPRAGEELEAERARALKLLMEPPEGVPAPSVIVFSGGGFQGFWRLKEPVRLNGVLERAEEAKRWNQQLEILFGADHCHNVDRIMRLPGTVNIPDEKKKKKGRTETLASVVERHDDRVYDIKQFNQAPKVQAGAPKGFSGGAGGVQVQAPGNVVRVQELSELDAWGVPERVKVIIVQGRHPDETKPKDDSRSAWLFDVLCNLVRAKVPDDVIYSLITDPDYGISDSVLDKGSNAERYALRQMERAHEEAIHPVLRDFNERFAVIGNIGGKCRIVEEVMDEALNRSRLTRQSFDDFRNRYMQPRVVVDPNPENPKTMGAGQWWLMHPNRRYYDKLVFNPKEDRVQPGAYNLWRGFGLLPRAGQAHEAFLEHTRSVICGGDEKLYDYLIKWCARSVQLPWLPGEVAVVLRGGMGIGKGQWVSWLQKIWGRHSLHITHSNHLVGNFNAHLRDCCMLFADEAFFAGDKKNESILRTLITEKTVMIEGKGVDAELQPNYIHLVMASNSQWVIPAGMDERRYYVLDVSAEQQRNYGYFDKFIEARDHGGVENLLHYLQTMDLSGYNVRDVPNTKALQEQKMYSMSAEEEWWHSKLVDGKLLYSHLEWHTEVSCDHLIRDYQEHVKATGKMHRATPTALGRFLTHALPTGWPKATQLVREEMEMGPDGLTSAIKRRRRMYQLPPLDVCREFFETRYRFQGLWRSEQQSLQPSDMLVGQVVEEIPF